jgi:hypothetical protein
MRSWVGVAIEPGSMSIACRSYFFERVDEVSEGNLSDVRGTS